MHWSHEETSKISFVHYILMGQDSVVSIATHYMVGSLGIESRWSEIFCTCPDWSRSPHSLLYSGYQVFLGGKVAGAWLDYPPLSSAEIKERVELYLYSPSGLLWHVLGWTSPLPLHNIQSHCQLNSDCRVRWWLKLLDCNPLLQHIVKFSKLTM
jgi:hypothetical protein